MIAVSRRIAGIALLGYQAAMMISRSIAMILNAVGIVALGLLALPLIVFLLVYSGIKKLFDWIELHSIFGGDAAGRDKARWRD